MNKEIPILIYLTFKEREHIITGLMSWKDTIKTIKSHTGENIISNRTLVEVEQLIEKLMKTK